MLEKLFNKQKRLENKIVRKYEKLKSLQRKLDTCSNDKKADSIEKQIISIREELKTMSTKFRLKDGRMENNDENVVEQPAKQQATEQQEQPIRQRLQEQKEQEEVVEQPQKPGILIKLVNTETLFVELKEENIEKTFTILVDMMISSVEGRKFDLFRVGNKFINPVQIVSIDIM